MYLNDVVGSVQRLEKQVRPPARGAAARGSSRTAQSCAVQIVHGTLKVFITRGAHADSCMCMCLAPPCVDLQP